MTGIQFVRHHRPTAPPPPEETTEFDPFAPSRTLDRSGPEANRASNQGERIRSGNTRRALFQFPSGEEEQLDTCSLEETSHSPFTLPELLLSRAKGESSPKPDAADPDPPHPQPITMAQTVTLKDALRVIPEFDGSNIPLSEFLEGCDEARAMINAVDEPNLVKLVRSKLLGEARSAIYGQFFSTLDALKGYIKGIYANTKTVHQLTGEMGNEFQRDNESVISYANRIREL